MNKFNWVMFCLVTIFLVFGVNSAFAADMTGTWKLEVTSAGGSGSPVFELKQTGNKLEGTYRGQWGEAPCTGEVKGKDFQINYNLGGTEVVYKGKVEGNKVKGTVDFGGQGSGDFTGAKQ